jgi:hypothetical protein
MSKQQSAMKILAFSFCLLLVVICNMVSSAQAFTPYSGCSKRSGLSTHIFAETAEAESAPSKSGGEDPNEIVARRIIVKGDVQGGYYRSCVLNEVRADNKY